MQMSRKSNNDICTGGREIKEWNWGIKIAIETTKGRQCWQWIRDEDEQDLFDPMNYFTIVLLCEVLGYMEMW